MEISIHENQILRALVDRIIPADEYPSGWQAGVGDFIQRILSTDLTADAQFVEQGLELVQKESYARYNDTDFIHLPQAAQNWIIEDLLVGKTTIDWTLSPVEFITLIIRLTVQGFYSDPENGGNRNAIAWKMINYHMGPKGGSWPKIDSFQPQTISWDTIHSTYEVIIVGAGAGGGVAACVLAEAGHRVLLIERGDWLTATALRPDHLRNQRTMLGYDTPAGPPSDGNPRVYSTSEGNVIVSPTDARWNNNAMTVGGGTRVFGAQAWRFCPEDFQMATTYGIPEGSSLADWPITYEDLAPFYDRAEWEIGVSGDPAGNSMAGSRTRGYPMPPLRSNIDETALSQGARSLGWKVGSVPLLINSVERDGRGACLHCGACVGFGCPGGFKNGTHNTVIARAIATGLCDVLTNTQVERILTDENGTVTGVAIVSDVDGSVRQHTVTADHIVLSAGAIETARLLLNSTSTREPNGIGNNQDQVGRNLQGHVYAGAIGIFDEPVQDCYGPGPTISTNDYRHHNEGIIGGAMLANEFVPTPLATWTTLTGSQIIPLWGIASKEGMRDLYSRLSVVMGPIQEMPNPEARVTIDPEVRDKFGIPVARLSGNIHPEDQKTANFAADKAAEWLTASGAKTVIPFSRVKSEGPSGGQHQAGTCRMGKDPSTSVTDEWGKVWGHDNVHIADGSLHVTNGGVNPVLTILANAYRISDHLATTLMSTDSETTVEKEG
jgi:choline dehydrogenase-like flavoprotein